MNISHFWPRWNI